MQKMITREQLGERLAMIRYARKRSQQEFGKPIGLGKTAMCKLESGQQGLSYLDSAILAQEHRFCLNALYQAIWDFNACLHPDPEQGPGDAE